MRILFVNPFYYPDIGGGAELVLQSLAEGFARRGHDVHVVCTGNGRDTYSEDINGVKVHRVKLRNTYWPLTKDHRSSLQRMVWHLIDAYNFRMMRPVAILMDEIKPDVVNYHNVVGLSALVWRLAKKRRIPTVQVLHDLYSLCPNSNMMKGGIPCQRQCGKCRTLRLFHPTLSRNVDSVVGVSAYVLERHTASSYFPSRKRSAVLHNVTNLPVIANKSFDPAGVLTIGFIGTLVENKGIELLLQALRKIKQANRVKLLVAGAGSADYEKHLRSLAGDNVEWLGYVQQTVFFQKIDVLVVPSIWHDTLPSVVFEAMVSDVPVIGSRRGGIPEMISHDIDGTLFEPEIDALTATLDGVIDSPAVINRWKAALSIKKEQYSAIVPWLDRYQQIFNDAIEATGK